MADERMNYASMEKMASAFTKAHNDIANTQKQLEKIAKTLEGGALLGDAGAAFVELILRAYKADPVVNLNTFHGKKAGRLAFPVELRCESAERLSLDDRSIDTIMMTWALCTIPDPAAALREMRRVLKPQGRMIFIEHGLSPDSGVQTWQNGLNPIWSRMAGGCNLNRKIDELLISSGFNIVELRTAYLPGPRPMTYTYEGCAVH